MMTKRGLRTKTMPTKSAPCSAAKTAWRGSWMPQILTRTGRVTLTLSRQGRGDRCERADLRRHIWRGDDSLADENGVGAPGAHLGGAGSRGDAALADDDALRRDEPTEALG